MLVIGWFASTKKQRSQFSFSEKFWMIFMKLGEGFTLALETMDRFQGWRPCTPLVYAAAFHFPLCPLCIVTFLTPNFFLLPFSLPSYWGTCSDAKWTYSGCCLVSKLVISFWMQEFHSFLVEEVRALWAPSSWFLSVKLPFRSLWHFLLCSPLFSHVLSIRYIWLRCWIVVVHNHWSGCTRIFWSVWQYFSISENRIYTYDTIFPHF